MAKILHFIDFLKFILSIPCFIRFVNISWAFEVGKWKFKILKFIYHPHCECGRTTVYRKIFFKIDIWGFWNTTLGLRNGTTE